MVKIGAMVDARFFSTWGPISSGPDALCTWSFSSIFLTPGSVISISSISGYGDVPGSRSFVRGPSRVKTDSNCLLSSFALSFGLLIEFPLTLRVATPVQSYRLLFTIARISSFLMLVHCLLPMVLLWTQCVSNRLAVALSRFPSSVISVSCQRFGSLRKNDQSSVLPFVSSCMSGLFWWASLFLTSCTAVVVSFYRFYWGQTFWQLMWRFPWTLATIRSLFLCPLIPRSAHELSPVLQPSCSILPSCTGWSALVSGGVLWVLRQLPLLICSGQRSLVWCLSC